MISTPARPALARRARRAEDRPRLHLVDRRVQDPQPHAARAEHRVDLLQRAHPLERALQLGQVVGLLDPRPLELLPRRRAVGQELVQRRVEQPDRDRQPVHRLEDPLEVGLLERQQLLERRARAPRRRRRGSPRAICGVAVSPKNMCSVRHRPMPSAPNSRGLARVLGRVGVGAHAAAARSSSAQRRTVSKSLAHLRLDQRHVLDGDRAGRAVDGDQVALAQHDAVDADLAGARRRSPAPPRR